MDRGAWQATDYEVAESTRLSACVHVFAHAHVRAHTHTHTHTHTITNENQLYSTGNSLLCGELNGRKFKKRGYMYMHSRYTLFYD